MSEAHAGRARKKKLRPSTNGEWKPLGKRAVDDRLDGPGDEEGITLRMARSRGRRQSGTTPTAGLRGANAVTLIEAAIACLLRPLQRGRHPAGVPTNHQQGWRFRTSRPVRLNRKRPDD